MTCGCGCPLPARPNGLYASDACRARAWKARRNYGPQEPRKGRSNGRRRSRDGNGVKLYVTPAEAEALARGVVLPSLATKATAKLKPAAQIAGQQSIYDVLTEEQDAHEDI